MQILFLLFSLSFAPVSLKATTVASAAPKTFILDGFDQSQVFVKTLGGQKVTLKRSEFPDITTVRWGSKIPVSSKYKSFSKIP